MTITLETLLLLQRVLDAQQMSVGDPDFDSLAPIVLAAKEELRQAIETAYLAMQDDGDAKR